jgi:acylphosphatase
MELTIYETLRIVAARQSLKLKTWVENLDDYQLEFLYEAMTQFSNQEHSKLMNEFKKDFKNNVNKVTLNAFNVSILLDC